MIDNTRSRDIQRRLGQQLTVILVMGALLLTTGCFKRQHVVYQGIVSPQAEVAPRSIAILPFRNQTEAPGLGPMVRKSFYGHLSPRRFQDIELDVVDRAVGNPENINFDHLTPEILRDLGTLLGCDAVLVGRVTEFERLFMGVYSQMSVGADIVIYDTHDGHRLWTDSEVTRLHDGGIPLTPLGIPLSGARSGWNLRDSQIIRAVDELTRAMAGRIPAPDSSVAAAGAAYEYELQVGAFLDHQLALDQRHILKSMGYPAAVHTELHRKTIWHRVMVGPYADKTKALDDLRKLEGLLGSRPFLRRRPL